MDLIIMTGLLIVAARKGLFKEALIKVVALLAATIGVSMATGVAAGWATKSGLIDDLGAAIAVAKIVIMVMEYAVLGWIAYSTFYKKERAKA